MSRHFVARCPVLAALGALLLTGSAGSQQVPQPAQKIKPTLQPVAETKLIMEGLANANFRGLEKLLKEEPASVQSWTFARGQALLIAETANLLLIRPPKGEAQNAWFEKAMGLRVTATQLAAAAAEKDYAKARGLYLTVAKTCNSCHSTFSVPVQVQPFAQPGEFKDVNLDAPHW